MVRLNLSSVASYQIVLLFNIKYLVNPLSDSILLIDLDREALSDFNYITRDYIIELEQTFNSSYISNRSTITDNRYLSGKVIEIKVVL